MVDGMHWNLISPVGVVGSPGLVIAEPEAETSQDMCNKMIYVIEARNEQPQTYSSQMHRQGSRRLLEDILVSWDGYQLVCRRNTLMVLKKVRGGDTLMILLPIEEEQAELVILSKCGLGGIIQ
nr:hypothetical protein [Tanacetum cinerariifolium]